MSPRRKLDVQKLQARISSAVDGCHEALEIIDGTEAEETESGEAIIVIIGTAAETLQKALSRAGNLMAQRRARPGGKRGPRPAPIAVPPPVCARCNDTHVMIHREDGHEDKMWPCTGCPVPCAGCRGRQSAYCAETPCACACHKANAPAGCGR